MDFLSQIFVCIYAKLKVKKKKKMHECTVEPDQTHFQKAPRSLVVHLVNLTSSKVSV